MTPRFSPNYGWSTLKMVFLPAREQAVLLLESEFKSRTGHAHAISFAYGRSGLYFLLKALNKPAAEVILPSDTCVVVAHAIQLAGYKPVFLDNSNGQRQPSEEDYLAAVNSKTAMIIPTHLYGLPQETVSLVAHIKQHRPDIFVLQDCAHSFFCRDTAGTVVTAYGDGALFGMNISKLVNCVQGGILTLQDGALAKQIQNLQKDSVRKNQLLSRSYVFAAALAFSYPLTLLLDFLRRKTSLLNSQTHYFKDDHIDLPANFAQKLDAFSAEIGLESLLKYDHRILQRQKLASLYTSVLKEVSNKDLLWYPPETPGATWSHFPILVAADKRDFYLQRLEKILGAEIGKIVDYSCADLEAYKKLGHPSCPRALLESTQMLNLPLTWFEKNLSTSPSFAEVEIKVRSGVQEAFREIS